MAREMKKTGVSWIGAIPSSWGLERLKWILNERKEKNDPQKTDFILSLGAAYGVIPYSEKEGGGNKAKESLTDYRLAYPNDIVMNSMNIISGSVGISKYFGCVSPVYYMLYPRNPEYSPEYYCYLFQTIAFQRSLLGLGNGILMKESSTGNFNTVRMRIPMEKLGVQLLPLPSSAEQHKIADFLDAECTRIDAVIEQTRSSIEEYKKLKQSVITQAVTKGIRSGRQMKDSEVEWVGEIPESWDVTRVKHVSSLVTDGAHVSPETENGMFDFISTVNVNNNEIDFESCLKTSASSYEYLVATGCKPRIGDVLISKDGTVGKTVIVKENRDFVVASSLVIIRPRQDMVSSEFLNYSLQSKAVQDTLLLLMHGAGLKRVSVAKNANLTIILPPQTEQQEIVDYLNTKCHEIDTLIEKKELYLSELELFKKSLIYEYVTGKKEVR